MMPHEILMRSRQPDQPSAARAVVSSPADLTGAPATDSQDHEPGDRPLVRIDALSVRFGIVQALSDVSLQVEPGEILSLLGPSGSGKSTLLRVVAGIDRPTEGRILIDGVEVASRNRFVEPERRRVGMVFQDYALFPHLTVAGNVAFGLRGFTRLEVDRTVGALLERVGLAGYASSYPHELSGGERQRVALVRALAPRPRVVLLDEPFSSLDGRLRERIALDTRDLLRETGITTIVVTHDPREAIRMAGPIALLRSGRLLQRGSADDLYARPMTAFAARFFGDVNELSATCRRGVVDTPLGAFAAPGLADSAAARICIRPQHLRVAGGASGIAARVLACEALGECDRVLLKVNGVRSPLVLCALGRARLTPGDAIHIEVDARSVIIVPDDEPDIVHGRVNGHRW